MANSPFWIVRPDDLEAAEGEAEVVAGPFDTEQAAKSERLKLIGNNPFSHLVAPTYGTGGVWLWKWLKFGQRISVMYGLLERQSDE